jgi:hypothetical protein
MIAIIAQNAAASLASCGSFACTLAAGRGDDSSSVLRFLYPHKFLEDPLRVLVSALVCALLVGVANAQNNTQPVVKPRVSTPVQELPSPNADTKVAPDAPVITIQGLCEKSQAAADCKTVVTRAEFEKVVNAIQPNMPKQQQKAMATQYVAALLLAQRAHEAGLDQGPKFDEQMQLQRLQLLARLAQEDMQKSASQVSDADIQAYYKQHSNEFQSISYDRLYVPKQKVDAAQIKPDDPEAQKKREASESAMKEEADKLRARAAAGEDFTKLQQDAYDFAGQKLKATNTRVDNVTKGRFPASDASIFELKVGEVSPVLNDPQAYMIYKIEAKKDQALDEVRPEITRALEQQRFQQESTDLRKTVTEKTSYDDAYFAAPAAPTLRNPGEPTPVPSTPPAGKK